MPSYPLPSDFGIEVDQLRTAARGLVRPECVLALASGELITSHGRGGYSVVDASGHVRHVVADAALGTHVANGIALGPDGVVRFADLAESGGGVYAVWHTGEIYPELTEIDGIPLPPTNFVTFEDETTMWLSVMTRTKPRWNAWRTSGGSGFIAVRDERGARIVADGLGYTNEFAFSPDGRWVYVNETYARRVSRYPRHEGNTLGDKEVVAQLSGGDIPDGLAFDAHGGLWVTCIGSNRLLVIRPDGDIQVIIDGSDPLHTKNVGDRLTQGTLTFEDMQSAGASLLANISSIAFGGPDRRTVYLGCLLGDSVRSFRVPVTGHELPHWNRSLAT